MDFEIQDDHGDMQRLSSDLNTARTEVDKLLSMVKSLERDREMSASRVKDLQRQLDEARRSERMPPGDGSSMYKMNTTDQVR